jgi:hypothetical protein
MKRHATALLALLLCSLAGASAGAQNTLLWTNSAQGFSPAHIQAFDKNTGALVHSYSGASGNGRGIVVVGNTIYYTMTDENIIHMMDASNGNDLGSITTATQSMSTIAWDGSSFWTSDYSGTNRAFQIALNGSTIKTITLSSAQQYMDGMEWFNNKLIANRGDAEHIYDVYDLDGNLLQANFITNPTSGSTGIAYDGTYFYVSNIFAASFARFDGNTGMFIDNIPATGQSYLLAEDLSVDYAQREDIPGTTTPEPASMILMATGLAGVAIARHRRKT